MHADHRCSFSGCKNVVVLDGNQKNQRPVCMAKDAGYIDFSSLPGSIKTGCINTPQLKSRFCEVHTPRACNSHPVHLRDKDVDEATSTNACDFHIKGSSTSGEPIVQVLLEKKTTRSDTYYKVIYILCPKSTH